MNITAELTSVAAKVLGVTAVPIDHWLSIKCHAVCPRLHAAFVLTMFTFFVIFVSI